MSTTRIAMWSGPRNISTAMMRSWENREDTVVVDEPLYAHYLANVDVDHPGKDEILESQSRDWRAVVDGLTGPVPDGKAIYYQKHMTHHMLPQVELAWLTDVRNCFLLRDPREVLLSYTKRRAEVTVQDVGIVRQAELFDHLCHALGEAPPVIEGRQVLEEPEKALRKVCEALGVAFSERMLSWPAGKRDSDGVWAKYWYDSVEASTGFAPHVERSGELSDQARRVEEQCRPHYERMREHCLDV